MSGERTSATTIRDRDGVGRARRGAGRRSLAGLLLLLVLAWLVASVILAHAGDPPALVFESGRFGAIEEDDPTDPKLKVTDIGNMRLVLSNAGTFGTSFLSRETPSMEWPARSGIDHLVRGALWVGAISAATGDTLVSSGGRDAYYLDAIFQHSEFTPIEGPPQEFSRLRTSPFFRPGTVSDENFHTVYVDTIPVVKGVGSGEEQHTPMGIRVIQETYGWGFDPLDDFIMVEFNVVNVGDVALQDVWIGMYSELVTNNRNSFSRWPPGGVWFDFQWPEWDSERRMVANRNKRGGNVGATEWSAIQLVGTGGFGPFGRGPDSIQTKQISLSAWSWSPSQFLGNWNDDSLYTFMSTGVAEFPEEIPDPDNTEINPVTIISLGPFSLLAPGDTLQAVFAFIAGTDLADLHENAFWSQKAYDDRYALPSPPSSPILRVYPRHHEVVVRWSEHPESELDPASKLLDFQGYRVYLSTSPRSAAFQLVHQYDVRDGVGFDSGLDAVRLDEPYIDDRGDTLWYELRLTGIPDGFKRYAAVTSYDYQIGDPPSLEGGVLQNSIYFIAGPDVEEARNARVSVFPNPYRGESGFDVRNPDGSINPRKRVLWFVNLPERAHIKIFTLAGDLVREYHFDAATYGGTETAGVSPDRADLAVGRNLVTGGSIAGFDLLNADGQEISSGLYIFSVRDKVTGETQLGKFMVIR
ncbi:MAG: hypothetical protein ACE5G2_04370 [Candidatus Krumholzibacteriia bacterium]